MKYLIGTVALLVASTSAFAQAPAGAPAGTTGTQTEAGSDTTESAAIAAGKRADHGKTCKAA